MGMGSELSAHQKLLLEMLKDFDAVCRRHGIRYQLFAGSALGAVRHNGFIPWDDDLDVILSRSEYERFFREAAMDFDPEIYYVQQEHSPHWSMHFPSCAAMARPALKNTTRRIRGFIRAFTLIFFPMIIWQVVRFNGGCNSPHPK